MSEPQKKEYEDWAHESGIEPTNDGWLAWQVAYIRCESENRHIWYKEGFLIGSGEENE